MFNDHEKLFTLREIAAEHFGNPKRYSTVWRLFRDEPGVINAGTGKRKIFRLVPASVLNRVLSRRAKGGKR
jgi:hypothetical protein